MLWLAEDHCVVAQSAASRNVKGRLDLHVRLRGLQPGAHAKSHGQHSFGAVSPGRSVCEWRQDDHSGASVGEKSARKTTQGSQMVTRGQKFVIQTRIFSSLLEHLYFHHVNLALVGINVSAQFHVVSYVILQSLRVDYIPRLLVCVGDEREFVAVRFYGALDIHQLRLLFLLLHFLRSSIMGENRNPKGRYRKCDC